ncbi:MAG: alpha/beta hydrolase, partial [Steroidobacteraceae bacterium]
LRGYAITGDALASLRAPTRMITSRDDPMILARDLDRIARPAVLEISVTSRGGHCGFMDALLGPSWIDRAIVQELLRE